MRIFLASLADATAFDDALAQRDGVRAVAGFCASAPARGRSTALVQARLHQQVLQGVRDALPLDAVRLYLPAAVDDGARKLIARIRAVVGIDTAIGVECGSRPA